MKYHYLKKTFLLSSIEVCNKFFDLANKSYISFFNLLNNEKFFIKISLFVLIFIN